MMTPIEIERNRAFMADLRANTVKAEAEFRNNITGGRCCLCVAWDSAVNHGLIPEHSEYTRDELPHMELAAYYGWPSPNPILVLDGKKRFASEWNDGMGDEPGDPVSHPEIALAFENTFPEIKP